MRALLLALALCATTAQAFDFVEGPFDVATPAGTRGACYASCPPEEGPPLESNTSQPLYVMCVNWWTGDASSFRCASQCRRRDSDPYPAGVFSWRWCRSMCLPRVIDGVTHWPGCHSQQFVKHNTRSFGPCDTGGCYYPSLEGIE